MLIFNPPTRAYKGYIFDLDGTLADSMSLHLHAWNEALRSVEAGLQLTAESFMLVAGMNWPQAVSHWNKTYALAIDPGSVIAARDRFFLERRHRLEPIPEILDFARERASDGAKVAVASGGHRDDVMETLRVIGANGLFSVVASGDEVEHSKPDPAIFLLAARRLGLDASDCIVIEDSPLGIQAAHAAGMDSVLLENAPAIAEG